MLSVVFYWPEDESQRSLVGRVPALHGFENDLCWTVQRPTWTTEWAMRQLRRGSIQPITLTSTNSVLSRWIGSRLEVITGKFNTVIILSGCSGIVSVGVSNAARERNGCITKDPTVDSYTTTSISYR